MYGWLRANLRGDAPGRSARENNFATKLRFRENNGSYLEKDLNLDENNRELGWRKWKNWEVRSAAQASAGKRR